MNFNNLDNQTPLFEYYPPKNKYIGLLSIPHSGLDLPADFTPYLNQDFNILRQDVDFAVHELVNIEMLQAAGIGIIKSNIIRTAIDLNRSPDKAVIAWKNNSHGHQVELKPLTKELEEKLLNTYYLPYFEMIKALIYELKNNTDLPTFIDLHSMPSKPTAYHFKQNPNQKESRPQFCISDQHGKTCSTEFIEFTKNEFLKDFKETAINDPYLGGHITQFINAEYKPINNIQIEINRSMYMDEQEFKLKDITEFKSLLTQKLIQIFEKFA